MPTGGALTITAGASVVERHAKLAPGAYVWISVADAGCGMDERTLQRAVEPFFTTKSTGHGTGLGLSMVDGLAAQSHGDLSIKSAVGAGTTATLWLPVSNEPVEALSVQGPQADVRHEDDAAWILLVDDEELVRMITASMLAEAGYRVAEAASAAEALHLIQGELDIRLVVTDYAMPGMTGVQLATVLRQRDPDLPVLMITGFANLSDQDAGGLPRLSKPFRQMELEDRIAQLLERGSARRR